MLVRGCENRSVNSLIVESQKEQDDLYLIGVPCEGIIDWQQVEQAGEHISSVEERDPRDVHPAGVNNRFELLHESCQRCLYLFLSADIVIGDPVANGSLDQSPKVKDFENRILKPAMPSSKKRNAASAAMPATKPAKLLLCGMLCGSNAPRWTESERRQQECKAGISSAFHQSGRCTSWCL